MHNISSRKRATWGHEAETIVCAESETARAVISVSQCRRVPTNTCPVYLCISNVH